MRRVRIALAVTCGVLLAACDPERTPTASGGFVQGNDVQSLDGSVLPAAADALASQLDIVHITFVRETGAPNAQVTTFAASSGAEYVVDLDDLESRGADGSVVLNGDTLLAPRTATGIGPRHVTATLTLDPLNTLVVRLLGKPGSVLLVRITPLKPVTLDAVTFTSPTTIQIGGLGAAFNTTITNHTAVALTGIGVQAWITQGLARRAAGGALVFCNADLGVLPPGTCTRIGDGVFPSNASAGTGTLVPGSAAAIIQVIELDGGRVVLDSLTIPITLTGPAPGDAWSTRASMPTPRYAFGLGVLNDQLYAVGGVVSSGAAVSTVEAYDPATDSWRARAALPNPRQGLGLGVINGRLYAVGGINAGGVVTDVEAYDPATDTWTARAALPIPLFNLGVAVVNGTLYAIGGIDASSAIVGTVEAYDPATDTWTARTAMPTARMEPGVVALDGRIYAIGGLTSGNGAVATVETYDPASDTWMTRASIPAPLYALGAGVVNDALYAVGGASTSSLAGVATVVRYDPATDTWTAGASMPTARWGLGVGGAGGMLYAVGGFGTSSFLYLSTVEAFQP